LRFMVAHIRGKGLAIFTGCSHAGIANICSHARDLFPETPLYALVGGLHLVYPNEDLIDPTIAALKEFNFSVIVPGTARAGGRSTRSPRYLGKTGSILWRSAPASRYRVNRDSRHCLRVPPTRRTYSKLATTAAPKGARKTTNPTSERPDAYSG
jgi:hypothetical protein